MVAVDPQCVKENTGLLRVGRAIHSQQGPFGVEADQTSPWSPVWLAMSEAVNRRLFATSSAPITRAERRLQVVNSRSITEVAPAAIRW